MKLKHCLTALLSFAVSATASSADFSVTDRATGYVLKFDIIRNGDGAGTKSTAAKVVPTPHQHEESFGGITVKVPKKVKHANREYEIIEIGDEAFANVTGVKEVILPSSITRIGSFAFRNCSDLESFTLPEHVMTAGADTGASTLHPSAFRGCDKLATLNFEPGTVTIDFLPWEGCNGLVNVNIPASVMVIKNLDKLYHLENIAVDPANKDFFCNDGLLFTGQPTGQRRTLFKVPCGAYGKIAVPDYTIDIDRGAFKGCTQVTDLTLPESILSFPAYNMFADMKSLEHLHIANKEKIAPNATNDRNKKVLLLLFHQQSSPTVIASGKTRGLIADKAGLYRIGLPNEGKSDKNSEDPRPRVEVAASQLPVAIETEKAVLPKAEKKDKADKKAKEKQSKQNKDEKKKEVKAQTVEPQEINESEN